VTPTRNLDLRCYFVTGHGDPARVVDAARAAVAGGAGVVQVRSKPIAARALTELTVAVAEAVHEINPRARVLVDDRVDVALAVRARGVPVHGVHVGQDDLPVRDVRALLGPDAIIGLTTGTLELVRAAHDVADALDYLGCGPFRATPTKDSGRAPIGLAGYPDLVAAAPVPLVAIGDVTADDAAALAATGVDGVAVVRGLMNAADPEAYARRIVEAF
jgi:thiamine-phosphate pyrophosphorylase